MCILYVTLFLNMHPSLPTHKEKSLSNLSGFKYMAIGIFNLFYLYSGKKINKKIII